MPAHESPAPKPLSALSDDQLVDRVRSGSSKAIEALFARYEQPLLAFCRHMLGRRDRGEEAVRESFAQALGTVRMHERPVNIRALLFAMARNRCLAVLTLEGDDAGELEVDGLDARVAREAPLGLLAAAVGALPADQRAALLLAEIGVHAEEEIATIVGAPRDKVAALVGQARMRVAGVEKPGDWHCAHAVLELAGHDGRPRRESVRRHLEECESCQRFCSLLEAQRGLLKVALPVAPSEGLRAPAPAAVARRARRPSEQAPASEQPRGWRTRTKVALAGAAALLLAVAIVTAGHGQGSATPGALAPVGAGRADAAAGGAGTGTGTAGATGDAGEVHAVDLRDADGMGPLTRAALEAQRILDR